jgi:hypothetical protein
MNMQLEKIVDMALENLKNYTNILGIWQDFAQKDIDGKLTFEINDKKIYIKF